MYIGDLRHRGPDWNEWGRHPMRGVWPQRYDDSRKTPSWARRGYEEYDTKSRKYMPLEFVGPFHPPAAAPHYRSPPSFNGGAPPWQHPPPPGAIMGQPQLRWARRHRKSMPKTPEEERAEWYQVLDFGNGMSVPASMFGGFGGGPGGGHAMIGGPNGYHHHKHHRWPSCSSDGSSGSGTWLSSSSSGSSGW